MAELRLKLGQTLGSKGWEKTRNKIVPTKVPRPTLAEKNLGTAAGARGVRGSGDCSAVESGRLE